ncbi:DUF3048 domain-containing protein [Bacillus alveayuensis]|uniref:DUF3048 domain-containing protein n=1 Tax=Aeribacillus alveayuensis TaxID=279215 RepID=UPI0005D12FEA|nr:DUF3048 domain-containing protein [Bacillus alveayuensis]
MRRWFIVVCSAFLLMGSGCTKTEKERMATNKEAVNQQTKIMEQEETPARKQFVFPLTGIETEQKPNHRVVAVMINNHPKARPQSGLHKADIVYEVLAEGDVTRFLALYQSEKPEKVGPVRSARDYYIELSKGYNALYICHGWSPGAKKMLESGALDYLNGLFYDGTLFQRASFRKAPHNSYITFENIEKGAEKQGYTLNAEIEPLPFFLEDVQGLAAKQVKIAYSNRSYAQVEYQYDETKGKYVRLSAGEQTIDYDSQEPVLIDNVFVVEMKHKVIDEASRRDIDLTSGGKAYLFQKGIVREVEWKNVDGRILPYENGIPIGLVPGKTWINIVPKLSIVDYQ